MSFLDGLISPLLTQTANARGAYVAGQKQENDKRVAQSLELLTLKRQQDKDDLAKQLGQANLTHLGAQTNLENQQAAVVGEKTDFAGHVFDNEGTPWIVHKDGSLSKASIRGASAAGIPGAAVGTDPNAGGRAGDNAENAPPPVTAAPSTSAQTQSSGLQPLPKFGAKPSDIMSPQWQQGEMFKAALAAQKAGTITPYQQAMLGMYQQRINAQQKQQAAKANQPTPDQVKSQTVESLATPAADALIAYHGGNGGMRQGAAAALSHVPMAGNYLEGKVDPDYQNAMNNARTLGTQYLEIMPKSRFQPSTIDDIMKQIAPNASDAAPVKAAKIARIKVLKAAIQKRAALRPDAQGPSLDDIPEPPSGTGEP